MYKLFAMDVDGTLTDGGIYVDGSGNEYKRFDYIEGIQDLIERRYAQSTSPMFRDWYHSFMVESPCPKCHGQRLNEQALSVRVGDKNIMQFTAMSVTQALTWLDGLKLSEEKTKIAEMVIKEIRSRLQSSGRYIVGRRGAANPSCDADRFEAVGCSLCA